MVARARKGVIFISFILIGLDVSLTMIRGRISNRVYRMPGDDARAVGWMRNVAFPVSGVHSQGGVSSLWFGKFPGCGSRVCHYGRAARTGRK